MKISEKCGKMVETKSKNIMGANSYVCRIVVLCHQNVSLVTYNQLHNILGLFDVLPNFPFTTSEPMHDYYLQTWHIPVSLTSRRIINSGS